MSDAAATPAPVRLYHSMWPDGREFDPVVAETMRRQGWVDRAADIVDDDQADDDDGIEPQGDDDSLTDPVDAPAPNPPTGFGHSTIGGPRG